MITDALKEQLKAECSLCGLIGHTEKFCWAKYTEYKTGNKTAHGTAFLKALALKRAETRKSTAQKNVTKKNDEFVDIKATSAVIMSGLGRLKEIEWLNMADDGDIAMGEN